MGGTEAARRSRCGSLRLFPTVHLTDGATPAFMPAETCDCSPFAVQKTVIFLFSILWGAVAILGARGDLPFEAREERVRKAVIEREARLAPAAPTYCVGHAAFGQRDLELGIHTAPSKRAYAARHGYTFVPVGAPDYEALLGRYCPGIAAEARLADAATGAKSPARPSPFFSSLVPRPASEGLRKKTNKVLRAPPRAGPRQVRLDAADGRRERRAGPGR